MESRELGDTGLTVTRMGLGLAALGRPGYINLGHAKDLHGDYDVDVMRERAHAVLDAAWRAGVRYFDAARSYGLGEQFLSSWLMAREIKPQEVTVGSKWGYTYTAGWQVMAERHEVKDHTAPTLRQQWVESRALLGPYLKLYQVHSATLESGVLENREVLEELARLREGGVRVGLTLSGPLQAWTLRRALEVNAAGPRVFDCVQATWNLLETSAGRVLQEARRAGMGVIVKEALANGRLTVRNEEPFFAPQKWRLQQTAGRLGASPDALALAGVLAQPWADVVLSGAATVRQLRSNLKAPRVPWDEQAADELAALRESPDEYWGRRGGLSWN